MADLGFGLVKHGCWGRSPGAIVSLPKTLDECEDKVPVSEFLSALATYVDTIPAVKFFITRRPEDRMSIQI